MRAEIVMRRVPRGLIADDDETQAVLDKIKLDERVLVKLHRPRSIDQHRLFWALLAHVAEATYFETPERLLVALKLELGRYDLMELRGKAVPVPHSISFGSMGQDDFQRFFDDSVRLICEKVIPGTKGDSLISEVQNMIGQRAA